MLEETEVLTEFDCPWCHVKIEPEYMGFGTRLVEVGREMLLLCKTCGDEYDITVIQALRNRLTNERADELGVTIENYKALQEEREYWLKYDEANVDDEVDVMDAAKAKRIFRDNRDPFEQRKTPIQIMRERFEAGLRKERERKIVVPARNIRAVKRRQNG